MKRTAIPLAIAAFVTPVAIAAARAQSDVVHVTVCELIATPDTFRNKRVEVAGTVISGPDVLALRDDRCLIGGVVRPMIWLTTDAKGLVRYSPGWTAKAYVEAKRAAPITRASANVAWVEPLPVSRVLESELDALNTAIRQNQGRETQAVVVGRLDTAPGGLIAEETDGRVRWSPGFGHLGGYSCQIVIESIRDVTFQ